MGPDLIPPNTHIRSVATCAAQVRGGKLRHGRVLFGLNQERSMALVLDADSGTNVMVNTMKIKLTDEAQRPLGD